MHTRCRMHPKADTKHVQVKYNNFSLSLFLLKKNIFFTAFKFLSPSKENSNICTRTINPSRLKQIWLWKRYAYFMVFPSLLQYRPRYYCKYTHNKIKAFLNLNAYISLHNQQKVTIFSVES